MDKALPSVDVDCNHCRAVCLDLGGTVTLQKCGACLSVSYCSKDCQVKDWKRHKSICKKVKQLNSGAETKNDTAQAFSVSEAMKGGIMVYFDSNDTMVGARKTSLAPSRALNTANAVCTLPVLLSVNGSDIAPIACNALFSAAVVTSTICSRLATSLGITSTEDNKASLTTVAVKAQMECTRAEHDGVLKVPVITQTTFAVEADPRYEIVLGKDWLHTVAHQCDRDAFIEFAPNKCCVRFLQKTVKTRAFADIPVEEVQNADSITMLWGIPDLGACEEATF